MKKVVYRFFATGRMNWFLLSLFSFSSYAQDMSEAQRLERCQNNRNRITELKDQLDTINVKLSRTMTIKELKIEEDKMIFVRSTKNLAKQYKGSAGDTGTALGKNISRVRRIAADYNYDYYGCFDVNKKLGLGPALALCSFELEKLIAQKIDKANSLNKPELLAIKSEIEKQLASHRNNLIVLRCNESSLSNDYSSDHTKLSGMWDLLSGGAIAGPMQLYVSEGGISGNWDHSPAKGKIISGSYDLATKKISFNYLQDWSKKTGKAQFDFSENSANYILTGTWRHDDGSGKGTWVMMKRK